MTGRIETPRGEVILVDNNTRAELRWFPGMANRWDARYDAAQKLLDSEVRKSLFKGEVPIYTKVRDEVPTLYGKTAEVGNVVVADGCRLNGTVENSVIFREVKVEAGAEVKDSIVMQGCVIEKGASVQYTILDKDVTVKSGTKLLGSAEHPLVIRKGVTV